MIENFVVMLAYPFMYRALIVGVMVSLCAAMLGVVLVLKRYALIGHGLGEVGFAALSLAVSLNLPPLAVSIPMVVAGSFVIMWMGRRGGVSGDIAIGIMATASLSFGVIITAMTKGFNIDVCNYMFGSILAMSKSDVILSAILSLVVISVFVLTFNRLFAITYDEVNARATGINVSLYQFVISFLTAITVVLGMRMMGTMLISSLIIFPAMTARKLVASFRAMVVVAAAISVVCFLVGLFLSAVVGLPTGASVVAVNLALLVAVNLISMLKRGSL